jgi:hypothetical protein
VQLTQGPLIIGGNLALLYKPLGSLCEVLGGSHAGEAKTCGLSQKQVCKGALQKASFLDSGTHWVKL